MKFIRIHSLILHMARQGKARRTRGLSLEKAYWKTLNSLLKFIIEILGAERREREREREREEREREKRERAATVAALRKNREIKKEI